VTQRAKPPFRADHVGSLLRSTALKEARGKRERGEITVEQFRQNYNDRLQQLSRRVGRPITTDQARALNLPVRRARR